MNKFLAGCAIVSALFCILNSFLIYRGFSIVESLIKEAKAEATSTVNAILPTWNADALIERATPELAAQEESIRLRFQELSSKLGKLTRLNELNIGKLSGSKSSKPTDSSHGLTILLQSSCTFEKGTGVLKIGMEQQQKNWKIAEFEVQAVNQKSEEKGVLL